MSGQDGTTPPPSSSSSSNIGTSSTTAANTDKLLKAYLPSDIVDYCLIDYMVGTKKYWKGEYNKVIKHFEYKIGTIERYKDKYKEDQRDCIQIFFSNYRLYKKLSAASLF